jgi:hypothetical protein
MLVRVTGVSAGVLSAPHQLTIGAREGSSVAEDGEEVRPMTIAIRKLERIETTARTCGCCGCYDC